MSGEPVRVLVADDHPALREGLQVLLGSAPGIEVVGQAGTGAEAVRLAEELQPDVVMMDLHMPDLSGIEATRRIVQATPHIRVLVLTMLEDDDSVFAAIRAGAYGYLLKGAGRDELTRAVIAVSQGELIMGPGIAQRARTFFAPGAASSSASAFPQLSERERQVLDLLARGYGNAAIGQRLFISPKTARNHVSNIFAKLHVADRAQAIVRAREAGLGGEASAASDPQARQAQRGTQPS
jgi:DNA-binding NarL/FixJ family response regulator